MSLITYQDSKPQRIDKYLAEKYPAFSRRYFQDGLKNDKILINNKKKSPSYKLKKEDVIEINLSLQPPKEINKLPANEKVSINIVAKYPDFLIIDKPTGLIVHPSIFDIQNNSIPPTLAGGLIAQFPELQNIGENFSRPAIVHRLDKDTSGLMIIPRTQKAFTEFKKQFKNREVSKIYLALCWNMQRKKDRLKLSNGGEVKYKKIITPIGKSKNDHTKQSTNKNINYLINPKEATTFYGMTYATQLSCNYKLGGIKKQAVPIALIQIKPKTGRKHQVRVHLSSVGLPLLGDKKYTSKVLKNCNKKFSHHLLQAHKLKFTYQGKKYSFTAKSPEWITTINN